MATQYTRTKRVREALIGAFRGTPFSVERLAPVLAIQFGENVGRSLFVDHRQTSSAVLHNSTAVEFITWDQPVVNLLAVRDRPPSEFALYYPLSPTKAPLLSEVDQPLVVTNDTFNEGWTIELNRKIAESSHKQVFATAADALNAVAGIVSAGIAP